MATKTVTLNPVIYTDGSGPQLATDLHAPYLPRTKRHRLRHGIGKVPEGISVAPLDDAPDIAALYVIELGASDDDGFDLTLGAHGGAPGRLRISIHITYDD